MPETAQSPTENPPNETSSVSDPWLKFLESRTCIRCRKPLADAVYVQCSECDVAIEAELQRRALRDAQESTESRLRSSGLPVAYRDGERLLGNLPVGSIADAYTACQMLGTRLKGLYLWGEAGSYKTSLAAAYMASQIKAGDSGRYVFVPDLLTDIHASYKDDDAESRATLIRRCVDAPLLILDDLGKEKASEHGAGVIFEILDGRYRNYRQGLWTIVTSNYDIDALCDRFPEGLGDPIRRRLSELTIAVPMDRK